MSTRAAISASTRRLPMLLSLCGRVRSPKCSFGQGIGFLPRRTREWEAGKGNTRIHGAPPPSLQIQFPKLSMLPHGYESPAPCVSETKCYESPAPCVSETKYTSQNLTAKATGFFPKPKPKTDIFIRNYTMQNFNAKANPNIFFCYVDKYGDLYFTANSVDEDGTITPKFYIYPPSLIKEDCFFTGASCDGVLLFQNKRWDHFLWNPTTNEIKTLPKTFVEHPRVTYVSMVCGMWCDHRHEDYKVLQVVMADTVDEEGDNIDLSYKIRLYSPKSNSWKKIPCTDLYCIRRPGVCINGVFYCVGSEKETKVLLTFDFSAETLSTLPLPSRFSEYSFCILEYNGLLSFLLYSADETVPSQFELWVMNGSWSRESVFHTCMVFEKW